MEYINGFLNFIFDTTKSLFIRLLLLSIFFFCVVLVDDYFQFSHNYRLNSQIQQVKEIESIVKETKDTIIIKTLKKTEYELLNSTSFVDYFSLFFERNVNRISSINKKIVSAISPNPIFHYFWSNLFLIVFMLWSIRSGFKKGKFGMVVLSIVLLIGFIFIFLFWFTGALTALISLMTDNKYLKIILVLLIQPLIVFSFYSIDLVKKISIKIYNDVKNYITS